MTCPSFRLRIYTEMDAAEWMGRVAEELLSS
jgi:hypothetical protein